MLHYISMWKSTSAEKVMADECHIMFCFDKRHSYGNTFLRKYIPMKVHSRIPIKIHSYETTLTKVDPLTFKWNIVEHSQTFNECWKSNGRWVWRYVHSYENTLTKVDPLTFTCRIVEHSQTEIMTGHESQLPATIAYWFVILYRKNTVALYTRTQRASFVPN